MTRPDVVAAVARLAQYTTNPSDDHLAAAYRCLSYLYNTRFYTLPFFSSSSLNSFQCFSNASFSGSPDDRRSHQGYLIKLFGSCVSWKAGKQPTVTTSSTKAELLALSHAAKEQIGLSRLFNELGLNLDDDLTLFCNNLQTIRLIKEPNTQLTTKLRHVDIHNH